MSVLSVFQASVKGAPIKSRRADDADRGWEKISNLMSEFIIKMDDMSGHIHPVEYSARAHKEFVFIHPFVDGNGRVARLLMNLIFLQKGYSIAIIPPILRGNYIQALEKAHTDDKAFIEFIAGAVRETQKDYLRLLKS